MHPIHRFEEFGEFYQALGYQRQAALPDFDILSLNESRHVGVPFIPPFRKSWYQVVIKRNPTKPVWLNTDRIEPTNAVLLFNAPHHVYSWQLDPALQGFVVLFKPNFVAGIANFEQEFPFFQLTETNFIDLQPADIQAFEGQIDQLLTTSTATDQYKRQILQALLTAFLYRCKSAYQRQQQVGSRQPRRLTLVSRFQQLIAALYLEKRTVTDYAHLLHVTPNYLNELVRDVTGSTARQLIVERLLTEAKNLLGHTDLDISTIAYTLQFDEPTNFGKFFRKYVGISPGQFRNRMREKSGEFTSIAVSGISA